MKIETIIYLRRDFSCWLGRHNRYNFVLQAPPRLRIIEKENFRNSLLDIVL